VDEPSQQALATAELQQLATRLNLLNQLERSLHETELRWQQALGVCRTLAATTWACRASEWE